MELNYDLCVYVLNMCLTLSKVQLSTYSPETSLPVAVQVPDFVPLRPACPLESEVLGLGSTSSVTHALFLSLAGEGRLVELTFPGWCSATLQHPSATQESPSPALSRCSPFLQRGSVSYSYPPCGLPQDASFLNSHSDSFNPHPLIYSA